MKCTLLVTTMSELIAVTLLLTLTLCSLNAHFLDKRTLGIREVKLVVNA